MNKYNARVTVTTSHGSNSYNINFNLDTSDDPKEVAKLIAWKKANGNNMFSSRIRKIKCHYVALDTSNQAQY